MSVILPSSTHRDQRGVPSGGTWPSAAGPFHQDVIRVKLRIAAGNGRHTDESRSPCLARSATNRDIGTPKPVEEDHARRRRMALAQQMKECVHVPQSSA